MYGRSLLLIAGAVGALAAAVIPGDAQRGGELFREARCVQCHGIAGEGGKSAPDLGRRVGRDSTPAGLAATLWNHGPAMWSAMEAQGISRPQVSEEQASDLFAYFHSVLYFEQPGDAARGKRLFDSKRCSGCHSLSEQGPGGAPAVREWDSLKSPIELARRMWNHARGMGEAMEKRGISWPELSAQELTDMLVYLENIPAARDRQSSLSVSDAAGGEKLLESKGCNNCHSGNLAFDRLGGEHHTLTAFAAAMWNHAQLMRRRAQGQGRELSEIEQGEMEKVVAVLWNKHLFRPEGTAAHGQKLFAEKNCASCHGDAGPGPDLDKARAARQDPIQPMTMVSVLWKHGPEMLRQMREKGLNWPNFTASEMADLIAYLNE